MPPIWARQEAHEDLNGEPGIADAFHIEERLVRIGLVLVQRPRPRVVRRHHRDVLYQWHTHVRVRF